VPAAPSRPARRHLWLRERRRVMPRPFAAPRAWSVKVAVIADDLTGAADSGVQLVRAGYRTAVAFRGSPVPPADDLDAVAVDTDSRAMSAASAAKLVVEAGHSMRGARVVFKKVDSTLRGPMAAELLAALEATGREVAVFCPAFPDAGRTVSDGVLLVNGVPVHETGFRDDPVTPVLESHLPTLLSAVCPTLATLSTEDLGNAGTVQSVLVNSNCVVADAGTDAELEALVRAVPDPASVLWVGSAGLVRAFGVVHAGPRAAEPNETPGSTSRVVVVVGSLNSVARKQLEVLLREAYMTPVALNAAALLDDPSKGAMKGAIAGARSALLDGRGVVVYSTADRGFEKMAKAEAARRVAEALAEVVTGLSKEDVFDALVLTGGDTAVRVAQRLGATGVLLQGEIEPGVPVGTLIGPKPYRVVTKAGGFGDAGTLLKAVQMLLKGGKD
jgi:D-threonate/D-erythronate kinase